MNSTIIPLVAIDCGKSVNVIGVYRDDDMLTSILEPVKLHTTYNGLGVATAIIDQMLADYGVVKLGNEPTSHYYEAWARHFMERYAEAIAEGRLIYRFVNPHQVKQARASLMKGRHRKTDPIDTWAIARCLKLNEGLLPAYLPGAQALCFQLWGDRYRQTAKALRRLARIVIADFDRLWPGAIVNVKRFQIAHPDMAPPVPLVETKSLNRKTLQAILTHCPNPYDILQLTEGEIIAFLREHVGRGGPKTAQHVLDVAQNAVLPPPDAAEAFAEKLTDDWALYQLHLERLAQLEAEAKVLVPNSPGAVLPSIPGVSDFFAARYFAGIRDIERFRSPNQIWAFAGFDPNLDASGDSHRVGKISRRGDPVFRNTLYMIGYHTAKHCAPIKRVYARARQRFRGDGHVTRATIHAANAANRLIFRMLVDQAPYDPNR